MMAMCVLGDGAIGDEPFFEDDGDYIHQRCAAASFVRALDPGGRWERCSPDLLARYPSICSDQGIETGMRRIVGLRDDGTCEGHDHWLVSEGGGSE